MLNVVAHRWHNLKGRVVLAAVCLLAVTAMQASVLSMLGSEPDWSKLDVYQDSITEARFADLMDRLYAPNAAWEEWIQLSGDAAWIRLHGDSDTHWYRLGFAESDEPGEPADSSPASDSAENTRPLAGLRIALDPGHIGGEFGPMEQRSFRISDQALTVQEGDLVLDVAKLLARRLETLGAEVWLTRDSAEPVTVVRPQDLRATARGQLGEDATEASVDARARILFYRVSEIRARARRLEAISDLDLVLALHFDAVAWKDQRKPALAQLNTAHILVNGACTDEELAFDDIRFEMLERLLRGYHQTEFEVASAISERMAEATQLPPLEYRGDNAVRISGDPYLWARNLLANRTFPAPVVYLEPYVANGREAHARIQSYLRWRKENPEAIEPPADSIIAEYAGFVVDGLIDWADKAGQSGK